MNALRYTLAIAVSIAALSTALAEARPAHDPRAIRTLERLIEATEGDDPDLPALLLRLADMYSQSASFWRHKAFQAGDDETAATALQDKARAAAEKALASYKRLVEEPTFAQYERRHEAVYLYSLQLREIGQEQAGLQALQQLLKHHPTSRYVPDAYLAFADHYFNQAALATAAKFYDKVLLFPKSSVYHYALYKKAWVKLNLGEYSVALELFHQVQATAPPRQRQLAIEARKDFVRAYSHVGKPKAAYRLFQDMDRKGALGLMEKLAGLYFDQGKLLDAIEAYQQLMRLQPADSRVCDWQLRVLQAQLSLGKMTAQVAAAREAVAVAQRLGNATCHEQVRGQIAQLARTWHRETAKVLTNAPHEAADAMYSLYRARYADAEDALEMTFFHGQLLALHADRLSDRAETRATWLRAAKAFDEVAQASGASAERRAEARQAAADARMRADALRP